MGDATPYVALGGLVAFVHIQHDFQDKITEVIICLKRDDLRVYKINDHFKVCLRVADAEGSDARGEIVKCFVHVYTIQDLRQKSTDSGHLDNWTQSSSKCE